MRRLLIASLFVFSATACGQVILNPARFPTALRNALQDPESSPILKCEVTPIKPALNFGFRFQAGYITRVPLNQYRGAGHGWALVTKITPEEGDAEPVYLATTAALPEIPKTNEIGETGGGYLLGEGRYNVEWMLFDDSKRVCRKKWKINVALTSGERKVKTAMPPNSIGELSLRGSTNGPGKDDVRSVRLTILMHAAPLFARRTKLRTGDVLVLLSGLSSLLERIPSPAVRLVVFNMDQQKELFRRDGFGLESLDQVAQSINGLELGLVDYQILQNRKAPAEFLAGLINKELSAPEPSELVLFLGPASRFGEKVAPPSLEQKPGPPYFYQFQFEPLFRRASATFPDTISHAVSRLKGKTIIVHTPGEFAKAIDQLESRIAGR